MQVPWFFRDLSSITRLRPWREAIAHLSSTPGMYLPLGYWQLLEKDGCIVGRKGGRQITYETVQRHLDNTSFISLVANGWIGTTMSQSAILEPIIRNIIESGRTLTLAVKTAVNLKERRAGAEVTSIR